MLKADIMPAVPEIYLAIMSMLLLLIGLFKKDSAGRFVSWFAILSLVVTAFLTTDIGFGQTTTFNGLFIADGYAALMKILVLIGAAASLMLSHNYLEKEGIFRFEYPVLAVLSTLGMMMMISANDLMSLYMGLELQSLPLFVLAAFHRDSVRSPEAGMKYFVLGALSSGMLLYGISMIYGYTGTTNFTLLAEALSVDATAEVSLALIIGIVFMLVGLAFKLSAVPFHMWTPDVYEGAPTSVTAFFAVAPKIAAVALITRVLMGPFHDLLAQWQQVIIFISFASMALGAIAGIAQTNIKRLMAYSSIGHVGYLLMGLAAGTQAGIQAMIIYVTIYMVMSLGAFAVILSMRIDGRAVEGIDDLSGLSKNQPLVALAMTIFMFSMSGIPPLAGFFGKFFIFQAAVHAELYTLAILGVISSVIAAYYYLRVIKVMYFDKPIENFDTPFSRTVCTVMCAAAILIVLFILFPAPLMDIAEAASGDLL